MKANKWILPGAIVLASLILAMSAWSTYYDGLFTNVLVKGQLNVDGTTRDKIKYVTGATTLTPYDGNVVYATLSAPATLTLPAITAEMDGMLLTVKLLSGTTTFTVSPDAANTIESTQGTTTGTSDTTIDANGDCRKWRAAYISGSTPYWAFETKEVQ